MRTTATRRLRRIAGVAGILLIPLLQVPAASRAATTPALSAERAIAIPGSQNKRDRAIMFRARGKKVDLRGGSGDVVITVRVGNQCAQSTASLRQAKTALVFP